MEEARKIEMIKRKLFSEEFRNEKIEEIIRRRNSFSKPLKNINKNKERRIWP